MEDYVYVLVCGNHIAGENQDTECYGVFKNEENAKKTMEYWIEYYSKEGWVVDEQYEKGDTLAIMFYKKQENWNEYFEFSIFETEIE